MNSSQVVPFYFQSNEVRTILVGNEPWFVAKDVCDILGIGNVTMALQKIPVNHLALNRIEGKRGQYEVNTVDEPGLYRLILRSDKPQAEPFMEWVTAEVLPAIRKTGSYSLSEGDKKVFVNHAHTKVTRAPNGLDIRYTMDLGKIVANPTRQSIEMLERLTGIQLSDIPLAESTKGDLDAWFLAFVEDCCFVEENERISSFLLYTAFREWLKKERKTPLPSISRFGNMAGNHFNRIKSGRIFYLGLNLIGEQQ